MDGGNDGSAEEQSAFLGEKYKGFEYGESDIPGLWVFLPLEGSYSCSEILVKYVMSCSEILVKYAMSCYVKGSHMLGRCMVIEVDSYSMIEPLKLNMKYVCSDLTFFLKKIHINYRIEPSVGIT